MSLVYGPSYLEEYSINGNTLVVLDGSNLRIMLSLKNILYTKLFLWAY